MTLEHAQQHASEIHRHIKPFCIRCEVAGSVRRRKPEPGDIEFVSIPDPRYMSQLKDFVNYRWGVPKIGAFPSKYTRIRSELLDIDFFWCSAETFGLNYFIRTGPQGFVTRALAHWKKITNGGYSSEARLWKPNGIGGFEHCPTPTEEDVFAALGCKKFVEPWNRTERGGPQRPGSVEGQHPSGESGPTLKDFAP